MEEHNELMLTLWYFVYNLPSRVPRFAAAGQHASFLVRPGVAEPVALAARGSAIGMLPVGRWTAGSADIPPDSRLYVFSDGAFEIVGAGGRAWTIEDLRGVIAQSEEPALPEARRIWRAVRGGARPGPLDDDVAILVVTFR